MNNISLLIPTLNAGNLWLEVLENIDKQSLELHKKIIIDSGSTDQTTKLALEHGFEVYHIDKKDFNHGTVRQQLTDMAGSDICIFLTQDAILSSQDSFANLANVFLTDEKIGLAYGRQLPHKNATALETHARLFNYPATSVIRSYNDKDKLGFKVFFCSNSFAAYRTSALQAVGGFPSDSIMGEDALVSAQMLIDGFKVAYVAGATVHHSHNYTIEAEFKRYFDTRVFHEQNKWLIEKYGKPTGEGIKFLKSELKYVIKNDPKSIFKAIASLGAKWLGYKSGKYYKQIPMKIRRKMSMHRSYWA